MKNFSHRLSVAGLILLAINGPWVHAQQDHEPPYATPSQSTAAATPTQSNEAQMPASGELTVQPARTFSGRIVKEDGKLVLQNPVTRVSHKLSEESKARKYLNQQVKITGKLDKNTNTIQIESIGPAS